MNTTSVGVNYFDGLFYPIRGWVYDAYCVNTKKAMAMLRESPATFLFCMEAMTRQASERMRAAGETEVYVVFVMGSRKRCTVSPDDRSIRSGTWIGWDDIRHVWYTNADFRCVIRTDDYSFNCRKLPVESVPHAAEVLIRRLT
jgi:hypothetical protein